MFCKFKIVCFYLKVNSRKFRSKIREEAEASGVIIEDIIEREVLIGRAECVILLVIKVEIFGLINKHHKEGQTLSETRLLTKLSKNNS